MLIPLGTDRPSHRPTLVTWVLIGLNLLVFAFTVAAERASPDSYHEMLQKFWLARTSFHWWGPVTSCFLHGGVLHVAFNMVFLAVFGPPVEDRFGRIWFTLFYLAGGVASGLLHILFDPAPIIGASGAIAGVTGAFVIMFPLTKIRCLWLLSANATWVDAWWFVGFAVVLDLVMAHFRGADGIAHLAHLGGYAFGSSIAFTLLATGRLARENYDVFAMLRQANRRREIKNAVTLHQREMAQRLAPGTQTATELAVTQARAEVTRLASQRQLEPAATAYLALVEQFPSVPLAHTTMARALQLELGNLFFASGRDRGAAAAYERFASVFKDDPETPRVLLMLALVYARRLADPARAAGALAVINGRLSSADERHLEAALLAEVAAHKAVTPGS